MNCYAVTSSYLINHKDTSRMKPKTIIVSVTAFALAGCATASKDIAPAYASPMQYQSYDCQQIAAENDRLVVRVSQLGGRLDEAANNDKAIGVVGALLFWPALFALGGTKGQEAEYARIRGEHDALQQAAIQKKCGANFAPLKPTDAVQTTGATTAAPVAATSVVTPTTVAAEVAPATKP